MEIFFKAVQNINANSLKELLNLGITIDAKALQRENAYFPMEVTKSGMATVLKKN